MGRFGEKTRGKTEGVWTCTEEKIGTTGDGKSVVATPDGKSRKKITLKFSSNKNDQLCW